MFQSRNKLFYGHVLNGSHKNVTNEKMSTTHNAAEEIQNDFTIASSKSSFQKKLLITDTFMLIWCLGDFNKTGIFLADELTLGIRGTDISHRLTEITDIL